MSGLNRSIGWKAYGLFGLGNIIGAGIYVLIGEVAGQAGNGAIWSFAVAGIVAGFTVISYSALATKFPLSAGEAVYILHSFKARKLALFIGLVLTFSAIVSGGALLNGFANYFSQLIDLPKIFYMVVAALVLVAVAIKGIKETAKLAIVITVIEVVGLLIIIIAALMKPDFYQKAGEVMATSFEPGSVGILLGGFLAFYAFIGFEDMVNVAEEVKDPKRNIKKGMFFAIASALILYGLVAVASLASLPAAQLAESEAPLSTVFQHVSGTSFPLIAIIGVFAITNGILAQIIMSSRVLYGLSREQLISKWFYSVNNKTQTPVKATVITGALILVAALSFPLVTLASMTSLALLIVFSVVHLTCIKLRKEVKLSPIFPALGLVANILVIGFQISRWL